MHIQSMDIFIEDDTAINVHVSPHSSYRRVQVGGRHGCGGLSLYFETKKQLQNMTDKLYGLLCDWNDNE